MGDKDFRERNEHGTDLDADAAAKAAGDEAHDEASTSAAGAAYLGGGARVQSGTTSVTGFADPKQQSYGHGAFMGAAGEFMKDTTWNQIFKAVWPSEFDRVAAIKEIREVMLALENNPVLAAYGECKALATKGEQKADPTHGPVIPQEWDVWLDKEHPGDLTKVKIAHGNTPTTVLQGAQKDKVVGYNRDDVKHAKNGAEWMELFGKSIAMYRGGVSDQAAADAQPEGKHEAMMKALSATTAEEAMATCAQFLNKKNGGGLILDVKSTYSSTSDINIFIDALKARGVDVFGVGTFRHSQLDGLEAGVRPVKFFHGITGVANASADGSLKQGDHLMFNAGSLLDKSGGWVRDVSYGINQSAFQTLSNLVTQHDLYVGLYVQEGDVDEKAVEVIMKMVNKFPHLFKDGFAYGNLSGKAETETEGTGMGSQGTLDKGDKLGAGGRAVKEGAKTAKDTVVDTVKSVWDKVW